MKSFHVVVLVVLFGLSSCEKVVQIPLNDTEPQIVVEAVGKSLVGQSYVLLSKTISSSGTPSGIERLLGAVVSVSDNEGESFVFEEDPTVDGRYIHPTFSVLPNTSYSLSVTYEGELLSAESRSLTKPQIDSFFVFRSVGGPGQEVGDTSNVLIYTVSDNPDEKNFYRFVLWVNGVKENIIFIETDDLGNGEVYTSPFFGISFDSEDLVYAELWSMNKQNYDYFSALNSNLNQSPFSAAPSGLPSNIENGIGYFGAFMMDTMSIIIP
ncbi:MAG: DUF4249 family protein [Crocinitomix sp.]|nr:DUF4249 family protein [Crocinitomix sp.]